MGDQRFYVERAPGDQPKRRLQIDRRRPIRRSNGKLIAPNVNSRDLDVFFWDREEQ